MSDEQPGRRGFITSRYTYYSPQERRARKIAFLAAIAEGQPIVEAAAQVDVPVRTIFSWRRTDPPFRHAWNLARAQSNRRDLSYPVPEPPQAVVTLHKFGLPEDGNDA